MLLLCGCATYHISPESLRDQLTSSNTVTRRANVTPMFFMGTPSVGAFLFMGAVVGGSAVYNSKNKGTQCNGLHEVLVLDKKEKEYWLPVTGRTGLKIVRRDGRHVIVYFDTVILEDSCISGSKTHFFKSRIKPIPLTDIAKLELQK
jgi:hypothetical protein